MSICNAKAHRVAIKESNMPAINSGANTKIEDKMARMRRHVLMKLTE